MIRPTTIASLVLAALALSFVSGEASDSREAHALRQDYNAVSAQIDSIVRLMSAVDPKALDASNLPAEGPQDLIPAGTRLVMIFWADDEARVWLNDYLVGETRLTPVEIEVPSLYLRATNQIRARCWDTDWVESGFLCGLYLKSRDGVLHPIAVSDDTWTTATGAAQLIAYAHPLPDIPGAEVIWQTSIFGTIELTRSFQSAAISQAAEKASDIYAAEVRANRRRMDYHAFVQSLAQLQERRESLATRLALLDRTSIPVPVYSGEKGRSLGFTLGRAGPLEERVSQPVSREVKAWAEQLPDRQKALIYPERRNLKGEGAANPAASQRAPGATATGDRTPDYRPPEERSTSPSGQEREDLETSDRKGTGGDGSGQGGSPGSSPRTGGSGGGEGSRLGLILPTLILATYVGFVISKWRELMEGGV